MDSLNQPAVSQTEAAQHQADPSLEMATANQPTSPPATTDSPAPAEPTPSPPAKGTSSFAAALIGSLESLMGTVVIAIFVITFIVQAFQIPSESMQNTLLVGDYLLVNKLCYGGSGPGDHVMPYQKIARGDIIVFHYPVDPQQHFVKRVIGLPGDRLRMKDKKVLINGRPLDEPYVFLKAANDLYRDDFPRTDIPAPNMDGSWWLQMRKLVEDGQLIVPQGHYFVMGDNRDDSLDSRYWGFVPQENIIGRPMLIYWSVDRDASPPSTFKARLERLAYAVTHLFQITRWDRTLRLVH